MNYMKIKKKKKSCINDFNEFIKNLKNEKNIQLRGNHICSTRREEKVDSNDTRVDNFIEQKHVILNCILPKFTKNF